jgi:predicted SAM-dependent methyltransferase
MMNIQEWFRIGMKRDIPLLIEPGTVQLTVGGSEVTDDRLYRPFWDAMTQGLPPYESEYVDTIWCNHFLEHLPGARAVEMLREFERVLRPRGTANIVTPYYSSQMQAQDLDHESVWCERTWATLFENQYYADYRRGWKLKVQACFIIGIVERNLALFTQLVKL